MRSYVYYPIVLLGLGISTAVTVNAEDYVNNYGNNPWSDNYNSSSSENGYGANYPYGRNNPPWGGAPYENFAPQSGTNYAYPAANQWYRSTGPNYGGADYYNRPNYRAPNYAAPPQQNDYYGWQNNQEFSNQNYETAPPNNRPNYSDYGAASNYGQRYNAPAPNYYGQYNHPNQNIPRSGRYGGSGGYGYNQPTNDWNWSMNQSYGTGNRPPNYPTWNSDRNNGNSFYGSNNQPQNMGQDSQYGSVTPNSENNPKQNFQERPSDNRETVANQNNYSAWDFPAAPDSNLPPSASVGSSSPAAAVEEGKSSNEPEKTK